jgi:hypothetical protein
MHELLDVGLTKATPTRHGPIGVDVGDAIGFALGAEKPGDLLYITGDTLWFEGTGDVARDFSPKVRERRRAVGVRVYSAAAFVEPVEARSSAGPVWRLRPSAQLIRPTWL